MWAILETVLCCLPLGIAAIIYASRANSKKATGDIHGAMEDAATAKKMLIIGVAIGAVIVVLYLIIAVLGAAFGGSGSSSDF